MSSPIVSNPTIPLDSLILVTAANGLIASHVADQLLAAGYRVRGTVRDSSKNAWMVSLFEGQYGPDRFELMEVPDVYLPGVWKGPVKGVAGIAHVFGPTDLQPEDCDLAAEEELPCHIALLEAAREEPTVKSFIHTSSAWAVWTPDASKKSKLTEWTWNEMAVEFARTKPNPEEHFFTQFMALKTLLEQKIWDWVKRENLPFNFNTNLLDTVIGHTLQPKDQGMPSTAGMVKWAFEGTNLHILMGMQPQWYIDTRDTGLLYVAALTTPGVDGERLFGFGERYSWAKVVQILGQIFPEKTLPVFPDNGWDQTDVPNEWSEELLLRVKQAGWTSLEESVKAGAKCF